LWVNTRPVFLSNEWLISHRCQHSGPAIAECCFDIIMKIEREKTYMSTIPISIDHPELINDVGELIWCQNVRYYEARKYR